MFVNVSDVPKILNKDESIRIESLIQANPKPTVIW